MKYPIGIQTFSQIIENGYVYVDKTEYIYNLINQGKYYFLSRPRRFGKSLLLSTIEAVFQGRRELFDGLFIAGTDWKWEKHPVFHFMLNGQDYSSVDRLDEKLGYYLGKWEEEYGIPDGSTMSVAIRFTNLISSVSEKTGRKVVILIDEYDQPLLQNVEQGKEDLHQAMREHLQAFYSVMKAQDAYIQFAILTGITKFSKVSVFSGLNNLKDITLDPRVNAICGISESELTEYFSDSISDLAKAIGSTIEDTKEKLKSEYDGYHFAATGEGVYNPFSLLNTFDMQQFSHYWFESGTPSFLIKLLRSSDWLLSDISGCTCSESELKGSDIYRSNPIPMLFQSGYLTIKGYDPEFKEYTLDYPNEEVAEGFSSDLLKSYSGIKNSESVIKQFIRAVRSGNADGFMAALQSLLSDVPYDQILNKELHYENIMFLIMKLMGFYTHTEYKTSDGRIDMVIKTDHYIYIMEFKLNGTAEEAMSQIRAKDYVRPFVGEGREIILIGAAFSPDTRRLDSWLISK
ncbi:MAG: ATP-binding protein [Lachnoclostridium sp.]|nr:ATP-binding protein [Lachnoclostridium sp.]